jgi:DNA-binding NtrC family response regulator
MARPVNRLLIIQKVNEISTLLRARLGPADFFVDVVAGLRSAQPKLAETAYDVVVCDVQQRAANCRSVFSALKGLLTKSPHTQIILIAAPDDPTAAGIEAKNCIIIRHPICEPELLRVISTAVKNKPTPADLDLLDPELLVPMEFEGIVTVGLPTRLIIQQILEAAAVDVPVLISGETGTGKDLVAAAIHKRSKRKHAAYVPINMGAIPSELIASELFGHEKGAYTGATETRRGLFEQAHGGTILLDEITTMNEKTQVYLLRVLETQTIRRLRGERDIEIDVRVLAATNENLEELVRAKRFREDLYYRLDVFRIHLPPLRERPAGMSFLTDYFVSRYAHQYQKSIRQVSRETYRLLRLYPWPGNVRELRNVIQRAVLLAENEELKPDLLPARIRECGQSNAVEFRSEVPFHVGMQLDDVEREFIRMTLATSGGNKQKSAAMLGISRRTLYNKLKRHGLL